MLSRQTKPSLLGVIAKNCGMQFMEIETASINDSFVKNCYSFRLLFSVYDSK